MQGQRAEMSNLAERERVWFQPVADLLDRFAWTGGFVVRLPDYRPELVRSMAYQLGLTYFDFRARVMQPLGWKAHRLQIEDLDSALLEQSQRQGLVAQNVEALLATKPAPEQERWLRGFLACAWQNPVVVPLVLFGRAAPPNPRVLGLAAEELPEQTLLMRLLS